MRKLKIIQILPTLNTGGVERGVLDFNKYLVKDIKEISIDILANAKCSHGLVVTAFA